MASTKKQGAASGPTNAVVLAAVLGIAARRQGNYLTLSEGIRYAIEKARAAGLSGRVLDVLGECIDTPRGETGDAEDDTVAAIMARVAAGI